MRRGQVTLFVVIGLLLLLTITFIFSLPENNSSIESNNDVEYYMQDCAEKKAERAMKLAGQTGGMFREEVAFTAYLDSMPSLNNIKQNLSKELKKGIKECAELDFPGKNVTPGNLSIDVSFAKTTRFEIENFYRIESRNQAMYEDYYEIELDIPFRKIYNTVEFILEDEYIHDRGMLRSEGLLIEGQDMQEYQLWAVTANDYVFAFALRN
ncbi:MAG: hypothetical protein ACOCQX_01320 [Candidatus Nanoarchaeia archaeon]